MAWNNGGGGNGEWNTSDFVWGAGDLWNNTGDDSAIFGGTTGTVTVAGTINVQGLTFTTASYTITGGTFNFGSGQGFINTSALASTSGNSTTIASNLVGTGGLTLAANGSLAANGGSSNTYVTISGDNTGLTGGITITGGLVGFGEDAANAQNAAGDNFIRLSNYGGIIDANKSFTLGNDIIVESTGGTIRLWGSATTTLTGAISGSGSINRTDGGTLWLRGSGADYTGTFNNQAGNTYFTQTNWGQASIDASNGVVHFQSTGQNATFQVASVTTNRDLHIHNNDTLDILSGTLNLRTTGGFWIQNSGTLTSSSGTLTVSSVDANGVVTSGNLTATTHDIRVRIVDANNGTTPVALVKNGANVLRLDQANTYSGGTTVNAGRVQADHVGAFGTGTVTVNNGGQVFLTANGTYANGFSLTGDGVTEEAGQLGSLRIGNNGITVSGNIALSGNARITTHAATDTGTLAGVISGGYGLEKTGVGTLILTADNTYTGITSLREGTLVLKGSLAGGLTASNATTFNQQGNVAGALTFGDNVAWRVTAGSGFISTDVTLNGTATAYIFDQVSSYAEGTHALVSYTGSLSGSGTVVLGNDTSAFRQTFAIDTTAPGAINLVISGAAGNLVWNGSDGNATWDVQTTSPWNNTATSAADVFYQNDTVTFNDTAAVKTVTLSDGASLTPAGITFDNSSGNNYTVEGAGAIVQQASGTLVKNGTGAVTINNTAANTFGSIAVNEGSLTLAGGTGRIQTIIGSATVENGSLTLGSRIALGAGQSITVNDGGILIANGGGNFSTALFTTAGSQIIINENGLFQTRGYHALGGTGGTFNQPVITINRGGVWQLEYEQYLAGNNLKLNGGTVNTAGQVRLQAGTVEVGASDTGSTIMGSQGVVLYGNATFQVADGVAANDLTISANVSENGARTLTKTGAGTLVFAGTGTYTGATTINAGTFVLDGAGVLANSDITVAGGATFLVDATGKTLKSLTLQGGSILDIAGASDQTTTITGTLTLGEGNLTVRAPITGSVAVNDIIALITAGSIVENGTLSTADIAGSRIKGITSVSGNILQFTITEAAANLIWNNNAGTGIWNTDGDVNFSGADGKFMAFDAVTFDDTLGSGDKTVTLSGELVPGAITVNNSDGNYTFDGTGSLAGSGTLTKSGTGTLTLGGTLGYGLSGAVTVQEGTLNLGGKTVSSASSLVLTGGTLENGTFSAATFNLQSGTISATLSGSGQIQKTTAGTVTLSAANTHTGGAVISAGTLLVTNAGALGTGTTIVNSGGQLNLGVYINSEGRSSIQLEGGTLAILGGTNFYANRNLGLNITGSNSLVTTYGTGTSILQGRFDVNSNSLVIAAGVTGVVFSETITLASGGGYGLRMDVDGEATIRGHINATGSANAVNSGVNASFFKRGAGNLILTGTATFAQALSLQNGTLSLSGSDERLAATTVVYTGATSNTSGVLALDGIRQTVGGIGVVGTGTGNAIVGANTTTATLVVNNSAADYTYSGRIGGDGANQNNIALEKDGTGILTLTGVNTYTGGTTIADGTLIVGSANALGSGAVNIGAAGTLNSGGFALANAIQGAGSIAGALTVADGGVLSPGNSIGTLTFTDNVTLANGAQLIIEIADASTFDILSFIGANNTLHFEAGAELIVLDLGGDTLLDGSYGIIQGATISGLENLSYGGNYTLDANGILTVVPEPSTYALFGAAGLVGLVALRRRRKA